MSDATVFQLSEHRATRREPRTARATPPLPDWALLGERAGLLLTRADIAITTGGSAELAALREELAGLRAALQSRRLDTDLLGQVWDLAIASTR